MALCMEREGMGERGGGRGEEGNREATPVRFHPAAFVPFHRLVLGEQHSAAQLSDAQHMT